MPKKGITGHDDWVLTEALATALVALEQLEPKHQPSAHMDDIRKMLANGKEPAAVSLHLAQAKCRLFPESIRWRSTGNTASARNMAEGGRHGRNSKARRPRGAGRG